MRFIRDLSNGHKPKGGNTKYANKTSDMRRTNNQFILIAKQIDWCVLSPSSICYLFIYYLRESNLQKFIKHLTYMHFSSL